MLPCEDTITHRHAKPVDPALVSGGRRKGSTSMEKDGTPRCCIWRNKLWLELWFCLVWETDDSRWSARASSLLLRVMLLALVSFSIESHSAAFVADLGLSSSPTQNQCWTPGPLPFHFTKQSDLSIKVASNRTPESKNGSVESSTIAAPEINEDADHRAEGTSDAWL